MNTLHIADTGLFVAMGQPSNSRYQAVRRFARHNNITFILPERVYDELTVDASDVVPPPIDTAIEEGWARVAAPLDYSHGLVSRTMDGVQRYIANADDRPADEIEHADPALAGVAAHVTKPSRNNTMPSGRATSTRSTTLSTTGSKRYGWISASGRPCDAGFGVSRTCASSERPTRSRRPPDCGRRVRYHADNR